MRTVYGICADELGLATKQTVEQGPTGLELRRRHWSTPAADLVPNQNPEIPVDIDHDPNRVVGALVHLHRHRRSGSVWAVAEVSDDVVPFTPVKVGADLVLVETPLYWSISRIGDPHNGYALDSIALTTRPARVGAKPVEWLDGTLDHRHVARERWHLAGWPAQLLTQAAIARLDRAKGSPIVVHDGSIDERSAVLHTVEKWQLFEQQDEQQRARLGLRPAGRIEHSKIRGRVLRVS